MITLQKFVESSNNSATGRVAYATFWRNHHLKMESIGIAIQNSA